MHSLTRTCHLELQTYVRLAFWRGNGYYLPGTVQSSQQHSLVLNEVGKSAPPFFCQEMGSFAIFRSGLERE